MLNAQPQPEQVTPLELEVALGKREWGGFYSTDFDDLLGLGPQDAPRPGTDHPDMESLALADPAAAAGGANGGGATNNADADKYGEDGDEDEDDDDDDRPFFSLVTGTYQNKPGVSRRPDGGQGGGGGGGSADNTAGGGGASEGALVGIGDRSLVEWSSPAADFLGKREFQGLEALVGQTEAKPATKGQSGIASDYGGV